MAQFQIETNKVINIDVFNFNLQDCQLEGRSALAEKLTLERDHVIITHKMHVLESEESTF